VKGSAKLHTSMIRTFADLTYIMRQCISADTQKKWLDDKK
jgi:hypothetical protein